jgi:conserved oligomeric Golgi complex subunit 8
LEKILKEPEILKHESNRIKRTIENEVFENYKSFIQTNECIHQLREYIDSIGGEVETMTTKLPTLTSSCSDFVGKSKEIDQER